MQFTRNIDAFLVLGISFVSVCLLLLPATGIGGSWLVVPAGLSGLAVFGAAVAIRNFPLIHLSLFFLLLFGWKWSPWWPRELPTGLLAPSLAYIVIIVLFRPLRESVTWFRRGALSRKTLLAALGVLALSLPALFAWAVFTENNIQDYIYLFHPRILYVELLIFALIFALINAFTQEIIFRGVFQDSLCASLGRGWPALLVQAFVFGLIHYVGVPDGISGIIMAFAYGIALGVLKNLSGGLLLPIAVHFVTDLFIFYLVFYKAALLDLLGAFPLL
ncbi:MAG TPA: CPBP family intramembrane glutamic endopeptidase [Anseongella sp.]|nr:CPBP family intramembrane glutamic endopeptidase [Anseongella sp.]